ncbi:hypothetical protein GCM10027290_29510 [Micromonospora sonneratiae]|uniref:Multiple cyclophane-containing RiPP AmcA n=1 Tax=Micromonospora sonneratiae TaxID=1184706 RepID=A0ABW3YFR9_9ACTN
MTLYLSRNATASAVDGSTGSARPDALIVTDRIVLPQIDPPLYTHVWHQLFARNPRRKDHR